MHRPTRRDFLKSSIAATVLGGISGAPPARAAAKRTATDWVQLGKSDVRVTRLAFGTGTYGGRVQRELGQQEFTKLVRHAYDRGIRFFETADAYRGMPQMLAEALKGVPRDSYKLMTKFRLTDRENPQPTIDRLRKDLNTDHLDILLMHCVRTPTWPDDLKRVEDAFEQAKSDKILLAHGASCHGLQALRQFPGMTWLDVALLRTNHNGTRMDTLQMRDTDDLGDVNEVVTHARKIKQQGAGLLGMKLIGEGRFTNAEDRDKAIKFAFDTAGVDAVTIGFKSTAEIDEAIDRIERVLNA
jgi:hypothetical protein